MNYAQVAASGWYSGADVLSIDAEENITAAEYTWKNLRASITILNSEEKKNSGDAQVLNLVKNKVKIAEKTMADLLGTGLFSDGTDAKSIQGLRDIVATDQTVGGISQSDYSWWQGKVDSSSTVLSMSVLQTLWSQCSIDAEHPTVLLGTRSNFDRYYGLLQPQQRFQDSKSAEGGFQSLMFNGAPFLIDSHAPANSVWLLNENYLHLFVHKAEDMKMTDFQMLPTQMVKTAHVLWMGAFGSSNNRMHGKASALTS